MCCNNVPLWLIVRGSFGTELEPVGHFGSPTQDGVLGRDGVKSGVALDCCQTPGVFAQIIAGLCALRVEIPHPALERPNRTTDIEIH